VTIGLFHKLIIAGCIGCVATTGVAGVIYPASDQTVVPRVSFQPLDAEVANLDLEDEALSQPSSTPAPRTASALAERFAAIGYEWDDVRALEDAVPRVFMARLPRDLPSVQEVDFRKSVFFRTMLPLVLKENERLREDRHRLLKLRAKSRLGFQLPAEDRLWLSAMADHYRLRSVDLDELVLRIDAIPVSLAIAQAAEESGWGTSRFAQKGNALFGQWTVESDRGIVPRDREPGKSHKIKVFETLHQSVAAYMRNLNSHRAYDEFRKMRAVARTSGDQPSGWALAGTLENYSQRGDAYIQSIRLIIDANDLQPLDTARFKDDLVRDSEA
jgi:Bax protein